MKKFYYELDGKTYSAHSKSEEGLLEKLPEGASIVSMDDSKELAMAKEKKMSEVRAERDEKLLENDKEWMIASKKGEDTSALEAEAQSLRDAPAAADSAIDAAIAAESSHEDKMAAVKAYAHFA